MKKQKHKKTALTIVFAIICLVYVMPIIIVGYNAFKTNAAVSTDAFALPNSETFSGWSNFIKGMTFGNYPFLKSALYSTFITVVSSLLILVCTSMAAWYVSRVGSLFSKIVYYLCVFSMVVPFQMVMFTRPARPTSCTSTRPGPFPSSTSASARGWPYSCSPALSSRYRLR